MARQVEFTEPVTTTLFSPAQLRPRALLTLMSAGFARWMAEHVASFPRLLGGYRTAVVVQAARLDYTAPDLTFDQAEWLTVRARMSANGAGDALWLWTEFLAGTRQVGQGRLVLRVVRLAETGSLAASPGALPDSLRSRFTADEVVSLDYRQILRDCALPLPGDPALAGVWETVLCRSHCEVADQWSFVEMIELATHARERLFTVDTSGAWAARHAVSAPVRSLRAVFRRPMFLFDECRVSTVAHGENGSGTVFRHELSRAGAQQVHLTVWERLDPVDPR